MSDLDIIIPFRESGAGDRSGPLGVVVGYLRRHFSPMNVKIIITDDPLHRKDWSKGRAVWAGVAKSKAPIVVIHDADVIVDAKALRKSIEAIRERKTKIDRFHWAIPHSTVRRLAERETGQLIGATPDNRLELIYGYLNYPRILKTLEQKTTPSWLEQLEYTAYHGGGITVLHRDLYQTFPIDPRFVGWGQEDESWAVTLHSLQGPPCQHGAGPLLHLWHRPCERMNRRCGNPAGVELARKYYHARKNKEDMLKLRREAFAAASDCT
jgi:hypothetical protein